MTKWTSNNKKWYVDRGYKYTGQRTEFRVKIKDLSEGSSVKVPVTCDYCGCTKEIAYRVYNLLTKKSNKYCCNKCKGWKMPATTYQRRKESGWKRLTGICSEKGYEIVTDKNSYTSTKMYIDYICPKHGSQRSQMNNMLAGHGCAMCKYESQNDNTRFTAEQVEEMVNSRNGNMLLNREDYKSMHEPNLKVRCSCGNIYTVSLQNFCYHGQTRCPQCSRKQSHNENKIQRLLEDRDVEFETEKTFDGLKDKANLRFDFYLPRYNLVIEYDGEGHYLEYFYRNFSDDPHSMLLNAQRRDSIKNKYCSENGINILRIPYWEAGNIETIIDRKLKELEQIA